MRNNVKRSQGFYVYIVRCRQGMYYTGYTHDLEKRIALHNSGRGAKYVRGKGPVTVVYTHRYCYFKHALRAERYIKQLTRRQKEALIQTGGVPCRNNRTVTKEVHS